MTQWFFELESGIQAAIIGAVTTILVALVGIGSLIWQIRSQAYQQRETIRETERRRLKSELLDSSIATSRALSDAAGKLAASIVSAQQSIEIASLMEKEGQPYSLPEQRIMRIADLQHDFSKLVADFTQMIESRLIVDPRLSIFRTAMNAASFDVREAFHKKYVRLAMRSLPADRPDGKPFEYRPPDDLSELKAYGFEVTEPLFDAGAYAEDFVVEIQNLLLGDVDKFEPVFCCGDMYH